MSKSKKNVINIELIKNFFNSKFNLLSIIPSIIIITACYIYFESIHNDIIPGVDNLNFEFYTDFANGGNSEILDQSVSDSSVSLRFKLKEDFSSPYVGITITNKLQSIFNFASYNRMYIEIAGEEVTSVGVSLYTNDYNNDSIEDVCFSGNLNIDKEIKKYVINLDNLSIPEWWYVVTNTPVDNKFEPSFSSVNRINIGPAITYASDVQRSLTIYSISFDRDNSSLVIFLVSIEILFVFVLILIHFLKSRKSFSVTVTYKAVDIEKEEQQKNSYLNYINNNFSNPDLTLELVSNETGVSQRRITSSIQQHFECNFKTYVNRLRINESKRLLLESDLNKGEIAYKVGFSNQTNFNRVFKSFEEITPSKFLEKN